jgi:hypothetical protein
MASKGSSARIVEERGRVKGSGQSPGIAVKQQSLAAAGKEISGVVDRIFRQQIFDVQQVQERRVKGGWIPERGDPVVGQLVLVIDGFHISEIMG